MLFYSWSSRATLLEPYQSCFFFPPRSFEFPHPAPAGAVPGRPERRAAAVSRRALHPGGADQKELRADRAGGHAGRLPELRPRAGPARVGLPRRQQGHQDLPDLPRGLLHGAAGHGQRAGLLRGLRAARVLLCPVRAHGLGAHGQVLGQRAHPLRHLGLPVRVPVLRRPAHRHARIRQAHLSGQVRLRGFGACNETTFFSWRRRRRSGGGIFFFPPSEEVLLKVPLPGFQSPRIFALLLLRTAFGFDTVRIVKIFCRFE